MTSKIEQVKSLFEVPEKYLGGRQFDIKVRVETVQEFTKNFKFDRVLDIGCGDGSISLPLLPRSKKLKLLDISSNMLDLVRNKIPVEHAANVELINRDIMGARFEPESFDLILCIGVLAHVDSPAGVVAEIARIAKPGASIILEFTDSFHFWSAPVVVYQKLLKLIRPEPYALNRLSKAHVIRWCEESGFRIKDLYRYGLPPIGTAKFFGQDQMYNMVRYLFGSHGRNRNRWMGNEFIFRLEKI
jgi:2-polyprenyl-6-hydroxyphenyl methylase / 3-demethylubiquinone-9 3-methyltransferase